MANNTFALMFLCTCALCSYPLCTYVLYTCRAATTNVMISLQIKLFMQNKAKFRKSQMNVINVITKEYEKKDTWWSEKKQSQTKPNKANLQNAQTNVNKVSTKNYEHILNWVIYENKANFDPKQSQTKPISEAKNAATRPYCRKRTLAYYRRIRVYFPDDDNLLRKK